MHIQCAKRIVKGKLLAINLIDCEKLAKWNSYYFNY